MKINITKIVEVYSYLTYKPFVKEEFKKNVEFDSMYNYIRNENIRHKNSSKWFRNFIAKDLKRLRAMFPFKPDKNNKLAREIYLKQGENSNDIILQGKYVKVVNEYTAFKITEWIYKLNKVEEFSPDDIYYVSNYWGSVYKDITHNMYMLKNVTNPDKKELSAFQNQLEIVENTNEFAKKDLLKRNNEKLEYLNERKLEAIEKLTEIEKDIQKIIDINNGLS